MNKYKKQSTASLRRRPNGDIYKEEKRVYTSI